MARQSPRDSRLRRERRSRPGSGNLRRGPVGRRAPQLGPRSIERPRAPASLLTQLAGSAGDAQGADRRPTKAATRPSRYCRLAATHRRSKTQVFGASRQGLLNATQDRPIENSGRTAVVRPKRFFPPLAGQREIGMQGHHRAAIGEGLAIAAIEIAFRRRLLCDQQVVAVKLYMPIADAGDRFLNDGRFIDEQACRNQHAVNKQVMRHRHPQIALRQASGQCPAAVRTGQTLWSCGCAAQSMSRQPIPLIGISSPDAVTTRSPTLSSSIARCGFLCPGNSRPAFARWSR